MANSPVNYGDEYGHVDFVLDLAFIAYDIYQIVQNPCDKSNWAALAADGVGLAIPGLTGGGLAVKAAAHADDGLKAANTAGRQIVKQADDLLAGNDVVVKTIREADEVLRTALPNAKKVKGPGPHKAPDPRPFKGKDPDGMYHKDYNIDPATDRVYGHGPDNAHGASKHINVKLPNGKKVIIRIEPKPK